MAGVRSAEEKEDGKNKRPTGGGRGSGVDVRIMILINGKIQELFLGRLVAADGVGGFVLKRSD
jgi:hypothetical protein